MQRTKMICSHRIAMKSKEKNANSTHAINLTVRRHVDRRFGRNSIFAPPITRHRLLLRVKQDSWFAVECVRTAACNRLFVSCEGEHGELESVNLMSKKGVKQGGLQVREWAH